MLFSCWVETPLAPHLESWVPSWPGPNRRIATWEFSNTRPPTRRPKRNPKTWRGDPVSISWPWRFWYNSGPSCILRNGCGWLWSEFPLSEPTVSTRQSMVEAMMTRRRRRRTTTTTTTPLEQKNPMKTIPWRPNGNDVRKSEDKSGNECNLEFCCLHMDGCPSVVWDTTCQLYYY